MSSARIYKKSKKTTVQLTSLLDLLFVMIFVSLIQQKTASVPVKKVVKTKAPEALRSYSVNGSFNFYGTPANPNIPSGAYQMQGSFDEKTRSLKLGGVNWIKRPTGYDMVPLSGTIEKTHTLFKGRVDFPGCKLFTLRRTKTLSNSPISGEWEGVYDCSQGPTGLKLIIQ